MSGDYVKPELVTPAMEREWAERKALLRVARAAKDEVDSCGFCKRGMECKAGHYKIREALKALPEGLLDQDIPKEAKLCDTPCSP